MIEQGVQAGTPFNQQLLSSLIELLIIVAVLWILRTVFRIIIRILKGIWNLLFGKRKNALESDDWLTRAQAKQEIRFKNSLPPLQAEQQPQKRKKRFFKKKGEGETWYSTGWTLNEETGLWEPPDYLKENTTYHYTKEEIPKENNEAPQQTHFHHEDTSFRVKQEPYTKPQTAQPESIYHYSKDNLTKDEATPGSKTTQSTGQESRGKPSAGPQIIYTYAKPELKAADREEVNSNGLDFKTAYQRKELFTRNEWLNYKKLRDIAEVRGFVIYPKVRLFDLVEPRQDKKKKLTYQYKIQAKHVDFVICDKEMNIKAVLELDDSSHYNPDRIKRDDFVNTILLSTGYTVIHTKYIDNSILDLI